MLMHVDFGGSSSNRLQEKMTLVVEDMETIPPHVIFPNENAGKPAPKMTRDVVGTEVVWENIGCGGVEKRRGF